jgi:hypothetical protein
MSSTEAEIELEIKTKGLTAPRLTPQHIDDTIADESYHVFYGIFTVCVLKLQNGFCVSGTSAPASPQNFDEELGRKISRENARNKIWELEGYRLVNALAKA